MTTPTVKRGRGRPRIESRPAIPLELTHFDQLPDSAHVRLQVVAGLFGCSTATVWRSAKKGIIPKPVKLTEKITAWNVGEIRKVLEVSRG